MEKNRKASVSISVYGLLFLLLLACNLLTPYVVDDFRYMYSFYDGERISSLWDIVMSMRVHRYHMNGRIAAHTLVQLFAMLPGWVFDIVNAAVYVLQIALLHRISKGSAHRSNLVLCALVCGAWLFCPAFGQVNLWQDGACNYLWSGVFALLYLIPFVDDFLYGKPVRTLFSKGIFLCLSFFMGAYSETVSAAAVFMSMLLIFLMLVVQKRKLKPLWCAALVMAILGYLFIYTAPAQLREKGAEMKLSVLLANFVNVAQQYWLLLGTLLLIFAAALVLNLVLKTEHKRIFLAQVFFAGSLAANFIMMFASYYTTRSAIGAFVFLLGACGILMYPLAERLKGKWLPGAAAAVMILAAMPALISGMQDIYSTCQGIRANEAYIYQCAEAGELDIQLPVVETRTKYSAINGLKYLDTEIADEWPNDSMSKYYGVNSILGITAE